MSDQDDVFNVNSGSPDNGSNDKQDQNPLLTDSAGSPAFSIPEDLVELVGEGKKYSSVEVALKSIPHAQQHISQLEREMAELKEDLNRRLSAEELVKRIGAKGEDGETHRKDFDPEAIAQLVRDTVQKQETEKTLTTNLGQVSARLKELWGDKASEILIERATELGVSVDYLRDTASATPKAFYKLIGVDERPSSGNQTLKGSVDLEKGLGHGNGPKAGTFEYYQALRRDNPSRYYTNEVQRKLHEDAKRLGDKFYG